MNEVYYSPKVKDYDPMDGVCLSFNSSEILNPSYSRKCLDYNPINKKSGFYQQGYTVKIFTETTYQPSMDRFRKKEADVMKYQPESRAVNKRPQLTLFKGVINNKNPFTRIVKKIIKSVRQWYRIFKGSGK